MTLRPRRKFLTPLALLLMMLLLPACFGAARRGVGVKSLAADLVFGIPALEEPAAPPDTVPSDVPVRDLGDVPKNTNLKRPISSAPPASACGEPEVNEVAAQAPDIAREQPKAGLYRWVQSGFQTYPPPIGKLPVPKFANRTVENVKPLPAKGDFQFTTTQIELGTSVAVAQTFQVINSRPAPPNPPQGAGQNIVRDQGSLNGIFLTQIVRETSDGKTTTFNPNPPVLYLPQPVVVGQSFTSQASDPTQFWTLTHTINVRGRERYNACGDLVDSWFVDGSQTFASSDENQNGTSDYNYGIGTQMGGIIVFEHRESPCPTYDEKAKSCAPEGATKFDANIGQLEPK